ncbi:MAG TPA: TonB-dependent receptor [Pyrinomonadaceae bacterium]|jgi:hemoglobin/transferrin/lactoferrin receptor protein
MKFKAFRLLITLFLTVFSLFSTAQAQTTSRVSGTVTDPNDAVIVGAQVILRGTISRAVVTNDKGEFAFENLPGGDYELKISANGFRDQSQKITVGEQSRTINVQLKIGSPTVSVTAEINQEVDRQDLPQAVNLIGSQEILERANPIIAQAAQEEAGINLQRTSPTMGGFFIRGLVGAKVNVYVDGVRYTTSAQRGGVSTFFNLNEPTGLQSIEVLRGSNGAQYGSDALGGTVSLLTRIPTLGDTEPEFHGEFNTGFNSADRSFGGSTLLSYGTNKLGGYVNLAARRVNNLRVARGIDTHSALTRFLGLPSNILGERLPDTAFTQYGGAFRLNYSPGKDSQLIFNYQRSQQDGGKRYDQLLGGDGNLIADLRNLMLDLGYLRYVKTNFLGFNTASFTVSYNSQREERVNQGGQGDPFGNITHQYERTTATGFSFFLDKDLPARNSFLFGGDIYNERVNAPAYTLTPATNVVRLSRPRVPDEAKYLLGGLFIQDAWQAIPDRLRISGALRYNVANYKVRGADSPVVAGFRLWNDDSLSVQDFSGRIGAVLRIYKEFRVAANYSRGFRTPSITDLGTLGLTGDGFEVDHTAAQRLGGTIGTTAGANAVTTGLPVEKQRSEVTNNYDFSVRYGNKRFETEATVFLIDFQDAITKQALILPTGAVGQSLGDQVINNQLANGVVFVPLSSSPVLVRANYTGARIYGFEWETEARLTKELKFTGNYTYIHAKDKLTGLPPNIEGGTPPPTGFVSFRYEPLGKPFWLEFYSTIADKQDRLSSLDLGDRRTGAARTRGQIANFFRRGACVRGLTTNTSGTGCGVTANNPTYILNSTGETLAQVQNRLLPIGATINGVTVIDVNTSVPLFTQLPSYAIMNLRGAFRFGERHQIFWAFENIFDRPYRNPSWGIDGAGRSIRVAYRFRF